MEGENTSLEGQLLMCPSCKTAYPAGSKFCGQDGGRLVPATGAAHIPPAPAPAPVKPPRGWMIAARVATVLAVAFAGAVKYATGSLPGLPETIAIFVIVAFLWYKADAVAKGA